VSVVEETATAPTAAPPTTSVRRARRPVQVGGFLRKETASVLRQPRLLLVLVAGPFLILLLFAVGYDEQQSVLRTAFVGPTGSIYEESIDQFTDELQRYVDSAGYSDDLVATEQQLQDGAIDAIVVFPADPLERVLSGEQAEITVLHDKIDPIQQVAVEVSAQVAVMELNARVLEEIVGRAQDTLVPVNESLAVADSVAEDLVTAAEAGDNEAAEAALDDLDSAVASLETIGSASSELARVLGADDATLDELTEFRQSVVELRSAADADGASGAASIETANNVRERLDRVTETAATAATIDPGVVVRPFSSATANLQREPIDVTDYFAPAAIALLLQHMVLTFAAMSLVTDRTLGLFEVFRVGPIDAPRVIAGKYLSFMLIGTVVAAALVALMVTALGLPMRGDVVWVAVGIGGLLAASIGLGLMLALLARSEVQAVQFAMLALLAALFFGGFFLDLEAFNYPVKLLSWVIPVTYATRLLRDVMLRGIDPSMFDLLGLAVTTIGFAAVAWWLLHRQLRVR
jgi:ABC-2 type transport system permease protein